MASQGPKPNRFAVTAGSVYFLENNGSQNFGDSLSDSPDDEVGWGRYVNGVWNYA